MSISGGSLPWRPGLILLVLVFVRSLFYGLGLACFVHGPVDSAGHQRDTEVPCIEQMSLLHLACAPWPVLDFGDIVQAWPPSLQGLHALQP
jgi:hypothetical protein